MAARQTRPGRINDVAQLAGKTRVKNIDWPLLAGVAAVTAIGLAMVYSASRQAGSGEVSVYFYRQIVWVAVAVVALVVAVVIDYHIVLSLAPVVFGAVALSLLWVLVAGHMAQGARRWLGYGPIRIQPSEISKIAIVLVMTKYFDAMRQRVRKFHVFCGALVLAGVLGFLIVLQPDLGTALVFVPVVFVMLYLGGCRRRHLAVLLVLGMLATPVLWAGLKDYQQRRLIAFINPSADPLGSGYQSLQSEIAIGSGGIFGKGWTRGTQSRLKYLPAQHTDFIFSVFAEEFGLAGSIALLALYMLILWRSAQLAIEARDFSGHVLAGGLTVLVAVHVLVNIAITVRMMPVTGLPLPFMSYGGSFMVTMAVCIGLVLNVGLRRTMF